MDKPKEPRKPNKEDDKYQGWVRVGHFYNDGINLLSEILERTSSKNIDNIRFIPTDWEDSQIDIEEKFDFDEKSFNADMMMYESLLGCYKLYTRRYKEYKEYEDKKEYERLKEKYEN